MSKAKAQAAGAIADLRKFCSDCEGDLQLVVSFGAWPDGSGLRVSTDETQEWNVFQCESCKKVVAVS